MKPHSPALPQNAPHNLAKPPSPTSKTPQADEDDREVVEKLIKRAHQVADEVRTRIVPIQQVSDDRYRVQFDDRHFEGQ